MFLQIDIIFPLALSLWLFAYAIRSLVFLFVSILKGSKVFLYTASKLPDVAQADNLCPCDATMYKGRRTSINNHIIENNNVQRDIRTITYIKSNTSMSLPFVSILVATYNEQLVITRLMKSCAALSYDRERFEIIVIDDSQDGTFDILKEWKQKLPNLKVLHRGDRIGWKGGALNLALKNMDNRSSFVLVIDADNILVNDTLEKFITCFVNSDLNEKHIDLIQGYPISGVFCSNDDNNTNKDRGKNDRHIDLRVGDRFNWIARGIDFRLAKRNLIEFLAKNFMNLPIQITGSLFMIRSEIIQSIGFSQDLTEDWDLTLDLYLSYSNNESIIKKRKIIFYPLLISYCEATTKFKEYFKQRMRVSEGHTRGLKRNTLRILTSKISYIDKIELLFTGLQYAKSIGIIGLIIIDYMLLSTNGVDFIMHNYFIKILLFVQFVSFLIIIGTNFISMSLCRNIRNYSIKDALYSMSLDVYSMPASILGSILGLSRRKGIFYKTKRNP
jgi:cellulose synthase/poly-beta-1,6-N-acetylglucosamine synthase-like glycosyltransferase